MLSNHRAVSKYSYRWNAVYPKAVPLQSSWVKYLGVLYNAHLCCPQHSSVQEKALLLGVEAHAVLLVRHGRLEHSLVYIRVKLLTLLAGVEALEAVLLQRRHEDVVGHLQAVVQGNKIRVVRGQFGRVNGAEGTVKGIDSLDEVAGEVLEGEVFGGLYFALGALLKIAVVCDRAEIFVLSMRRQDECRCAGREAWRTLRSTISLSFFASCSFSCDASSLGACFWLAASPSSFASAGAASEYHRIAGAARVMGANAGCMRGAGRAACLAARNIVL